MACQQEYYVNVKRDVARRFGAAVAAFGLIGFVVLVASSSHAQTSGTHASASSSSGSHAITTSRPVPRPNHPVDPARLPRRYPYGGIYAVGVPVPYGSDAASDAQNDADANYQGGPTIFDRRGSGAQSYIPPVANAPSPHSGQSVAPDPPEAESAQEITTLVFKDGRQVEVGNYAIVGRNIYDMSPGHSLKVPLADLDLGATQKQNNEHGVNFQVPPSARVN
jgi:hypothetical protein